MAGTSGHYGINSYLRIELGEPGCRYIYEHRLVLIGKLGRIIGPEELIHHKNNIRFDNRICNLQLTNKKGHEKEHPVWNRGKGTKCNNPEYMKKYNQQYREIHREKLRENNKRYRQRLREKKVNYGEFGGGMLR